MLYYQQILAASATITNCYWYPSYNCHHYYCSLPAFQLLMSDAPSGLGGDREAQTIFDVVHGLTQDLDHSKALVEAHLFGGVSNRSENFPEIMFLAKKG